ncbi:MAG TPA: VOC family protein [Dehalococcoidia bacterium]|nr:VOC family protein [Dehalococcoidia bacterium]
MQSRLGHMQFNVRPENMPFYRDLMGFLGWQSLYDGAGSEAGEPMLGVAAANGASLWFAGKVNAAHNDYDGPGLNHLAIAVVAQSDVDATVEYLRQRGVPALFETPRHRPEFSGGPGQTYYQVMFESPDRILLEVVYTGPTSA